MSFTVRPGKYVHHVAENYDLFLSRRLKRADLARLVAAIDKGHSDGFFTEVTFLDDGRVMIAGVDAIEAQVQALRYFGVAP